MTASTIWTRLLAGGVLLAAATVGCGSDQPSAPPVTYQGSGFVSVHDEYGALLAFDSGVTVSVPNDDPTAVSTTNGAYSLSGMKLPTVTLTYAMTGMGTLQRLHVDVRASSALGTTQLGLRSTASVTNLATNVRPDTLNITGTVTAPPVGLARRVRLFIGADSASVSATEGTYVLTTTQDVRGTGAFTARVVGVPLRTLRNLLSPGGAAFVVAYGENLGFMNQYADTATGATVYPNVGTTASGVVRFAVP